MRPLAVGIGHVQGVTLADTLPSGSTFVDVNTTKGSCAAPAGGVVNCSIGDIAFTSSETVTVRVRLPVAGCRWLRYDRRTEHRRYAPNWLALRHC